MKISLPTTHLCQCYNLNFIQCEILKLFPQYSNKTYLADATEKKYGSSLCG